MEQNIETKDVQRTEYLDKNGLDMLWAKVKENTHNQVEVERNRAVAKENSITNSLSEFVSKTATDGQSIKSSLYVSDKLRISNNTNSSQISLRASDGAPILSIYAMGGKQYNASLTSRELRMSSNQNDVVITCNGISNSDDNANHVFATDGSIADLTQYAKKSEITAGSNVDDVQVNGVSIIENKVANIKPATKESLGVVKVGDGLNVTDGTISVDSTAIGAGNYIPYARYEHDEYIMLNNIRVEGNGTANALNSSIGRNGLSVYKMLNSSIHSNIQCAEIELQSDKNRVRINDDGIDIWKLDVHAVGGISDYLLGLSKRGIRLYHGDDNHVLTSNASTIDITQYVLKSVYDEKIAALEARIAALEAKHAETA